MTVDYMASSEQLVQNCLKEGADSAEVFIQTGRRLSIEVRNSEVEPRKKHFGESELYKGQVTEPMKVATPAPQPAAAAAKGVAEAKGFSLHQFKVLVRRNWELKFGDRGQTLLLFFQAPLVALLVALMASEPNQIQTVFRSWVSVCAGAAVLMSRQEISL
jgi:hypothetical protein